MKIIMKMFLVLGMVLIISSPGFAGLQTTITLDSLDDSSGDYMDGISLFFEAGLYEFSVVDGAWNAWFSSVDTGGTGCDVNGENCYTGWMWSMDIYEPGTSTYYRLGSKIDRYNDPDQALAAHQADTLLLNHETDGELWFFVKDGHPGKGDVLVWDNMGSVTLAVEMKSAPPVVPEPVSSALFVVGGVTFGLRNFVKKRRKSLSCS